MIEPERKSYIRQLAARLLLIQDQLTSVIDVRDMSLPGAIRILPFEKYAHITGYTVRELTFDGVYNDGYTIIAGDTRIVLYNAGYDITCPQRLRFSLAHEIGHIFLQHVEDDAQSEEEANYFASQIVAHDAIAVALLTGNWGVDLCIVREQFGVSWDTAFIKLKNINRNTHAYTAMEYQLWCKYKQLFSTHRYRKNKFAISSSPVYVECDDEEMLL